MDSYLTLNADTEIAINKSMTVERIRIKHVWVHNDAKYVLACGIQDVNLLYDFKSGKLIGKKLVQHAGNVIFQLLPNVGVENSLVISLNFPRVDHIIDLKSTLYLPKEANKQSQKTGIPKGKSSDNMIISSYARHGEAFFEEKDIGCAVLTEIGQVVGIVVAYDEHSIQAKILPIDVFVNSFDINEKFRVVLELPEFTNIKFPDVSWNSQDIPIIHLSFLEKGKLIHSILRLGIFNISLTTRIQDLQGKPPYSTISWKESSNLEECKLFESSVNSSLIYPLDQLSYAIPGSQTLALAILAWEICTGSIWNKVDVTNVGDLPSWIPLAFKMLFCKTFFPSTIDCLV